MRIKLYNLQWVIAALLFVLPLMSSSQNQWINIADRKKGGDDELLTKTIQQAIDQAASEGGGTIYFPAGEYLTGAIHFKSNITLHLDAGAVLKFSDDF